MWFSMYAHVTPIIHEILGKPSLKKNTSGPDYGPVANMASLNSVLLSFRILIHEVLFSSV